MFQFHAHSAKRIIFFISVSDESHYSPFHLSTQRILRFFLRIAFSFHSHPPKLVDTCFQLRTSPQLNTMAEFVPRHESFWNHAFRQVPGCFPARCRAGKLDVRVVARKGNHASLKPCCGKCRNSTTVIVDHDDLLPTHNARCAGIIFE